MSFFVFYAIFSNTMLSFIKIHTFFPAYELKLTKVKDKNQWVEIDATVVHANKSGKFIF